jgi:hypothetical protein
MTDFAKWDAFYGIVGPSGGALIGVQFVVVTLVANMRVRPTAESIHAFATPTVVNFGVALLVSSLMSVPWISLFHASAMLAVCGLGGLGYVAVVVRYVRRQTRYEPVWEDWLWYAILPCALYAALALAGMILSMAVQLSLFVVAGASLGLLLIGIHNAWDTVTHIVVDAQSAATKLE